MDRKWRALIIVCVAIFMLLLDITVVNVALPSIQKELHTSFVDLQWVVDAYALMLATATLTAGSLGDLLGRKRVFIAGVLLFTAASAACGAANSPLFLNLARGFQGVGGAIMFAVSLAILSQEFHGKERGTAFGIWGATIGAAVAIGPLVGGVLTTWLGWRWIFFVNLPIGIACAIGSVRVLHESRNDEHGGFDPAGFVTLTGGLFALVLALLRGNDWHWGSGRELTLLAVAAVLLVAFVVVELRQPAPTFDVRLFRVPTFTAAQIVAFTISGGMFAQFLYLTLYLQNVLGYSPIQAGLRFLPLSLVSFFVAPIAGRLSARLPVRLLLSLGLALTGLALVLMSMVKVSSGWTVLLPGFIISGIGIGLVNPPLASTAVSVVEPRLAGVASGINTTFRQIGIATGIAGLGAIFQNRIASGLHGAGISTKVVASGHVLQGGALARHAFVSGLHTILLVGAFVAFAGAVLALLLVRQQDFVASRPAPAAAS
ncbi:MAG TPA: MFS transporter [Verrucomicrobiae bacterium]|nr:MFS transporter [Verrucomicrobiae bacterium]